MHTLFATFAEYLVLVAQTLFRNTLLADEMLAAQHERGLLRLVEALITINAFELQSLLTKRLENFIMRQRLVLSFILQIRVYVFHTLFQIKL